MSASDEMNESDKVFAILDAHDPDESDRLRCYFGADEIPIDMARDFLERAPDDPAFILEQLNTYVFADKDEQAIMRSFHENDGPEMIVKAIDGTPTPSDLREQFGKETT